ncbi:MAG: bifunctional salicylyl-CoA 5-hydroxylase/oxidoreductase [Myxococcales bacterium]|nr:bifunctional salicylyl-CoA 5-hydroxylase/oxidoreductase [Myxococcales bacterium]
MGGGPAGLFYAICHKLRAPGDTVVVFERNRRDDTFGFGVVFSDATLDGLRPVDPPTFDAVAKALHHWDAIDVTVDRGPTITSHGHGFAGVSRRTLLQLLAARASALGVTLRYHEEAPDVDALSAAYDLVVASDGVSSRVRQHYAAHFEPSIDLRPNRFTWLGTTCPFEAFTFYFDHNDAGLWRVHAYQYEPGQSTFIVETTQETYARSGLAEDDDAATLRYCEALFEHRLKGHRLLANRSIWRRFPIVKNARWYHKNVVIVGDAAHTAHFSIGSGTKLAMEDAVALADAVASHPQLADALAAYDRLRRPAVDSTQRAAETSLRWFEETERYINDPPVQFGFSLLTRSLRITHADLKKRDPAYVAAIDAWCAETAEAQTGRRAASTRNAAPPPMFTPYTLRSMTLANRVVMSPMCQYKAVDGVPGAWHLVHYGSRALGGPGLIMTEMTDVSPEARITPGCTGLWNDAQRDAWASLVDFVHRESPARIGVQLSHAGRKGATCVPWEGGYDTPLDAAAQPWGLVAPSALAWGPESAVPRAMTRDDMVAVCEDFVKATARAAEAGFDHLELHAAHGYLLASFLSPLTNRRDDAWGGSLENRLRFPLEVFAAMRRAWPAERPMAVRISAEDWVDGGITAADAVRIARAFADAGCDLIDVSAGQTTPDARPRYGRLFQTPFSDQIRREARIATMAVGAITSASDINTIIAAGRADLCALGRAHLFDPYYTLHAAREQDEPMPWPSPYAAVERFTPRVK